MLEAILDRSFVSSRIPTQMALVLLIMLYVTKINYAGLPMMIQITFYSSSEKYNWKLCKRKILLAADDDLRPDFGIRGNVRKHMHCAKVRLKWTSAELPLKSHRRIHFDWRARAFISVWNSSVYY